MGYEIDRNAPSESFLKARQIAGQALQTQFHMERGKVDEPHDFKWVKTELTRPSFDHLTFSYRNQVFSVLVGFTEGNKLSLSKKEIDRCLEACASNNLIPCLFPIDEQTMKPILPGWNLLHLATQEPIVPEDASSEAQVEMSQWELRNFCIQIVRNHIEENGGKVDSFCDVLGIDPQVWFQDKDGNRAWVIVRHYAQIAGDEKSSWIGFEQSNPQLAAYDGYLAAVSIASSGPFLYGKDGKLIPLSQMFTGNAPRYRGDGFCVKFDGLQRIFVS